MPFLFPSLLALAALAGVPILIHLLNRRRYKPVVWAAMTFLRDAMREEAKRIQYKDLLLMMMRALVCILLALAIARPVTRLLAGQAASKRGVIVVMDRSASMSLSTGTATLMAAARREALSILRGLPADTQIGLIDAARPAAVAIPRTRDLREVERALEELGASDAGTDIGGAMRHAVDLARGMERVAGIDVYVFSDMQSTAWRGAAESVRKAMAELGPATKAYVVPLGAQESGNLAVTALRIDPPVVAAQQPFVAEVEVLNGGAEAAQNVLVELRVNGAPAATAQLPSLEPGGTTKVRLLAETAVPGLTVVEAVVEQGRGRFAADDIRRGVLRVAQGLQVLLVDGEPGATFGQGEVDFLEAALVPEFEGGAPVPYRVTKIAAASVTPRDVLDKDLIFLCNVPALRPELATQLRTAVERGAGLVVFLGKLVGPGAYATYATPVAGGPEPLLPATVGKMFPPESSAGAADRPEPVYLSSERLEHEWMSFFRAKETLPLLRVPVQRALALGVTTGAATRVVAWYENGIPAIAEKRLGRGRVVLVGTSADPDWNALCLEPLGPILISRIAAALLPGSATVRATEVGTRVRLPLPPEERRLNIRLTTAESKVLTVQAEMAGDQASLEYDGLGRSGVYRYQIDTVPPREELFVLNLPADESDIRPLGAGALAELFPSGEFRWIQDRDAGSAGSALRQTRLGHELWWPVLLAAFLLLVGEIVFARLMTTEAPSADELPAQARAAQHRGAAGAAAVRGRERT